ncbi:MAG: glycerol-3-phosphate 1-O-acyltransferase PlsY [Bacteroidia bacterium]|nr:glycerol-3-phosphate 1-O-acyltransferase PlsY [Bacteroidia bacterium]MDW8235795.1 glycerol-3-phosphate 1-O-acyltransferase PlsY [Bacteroidia bacterium]
MEIALFIIVAYLFGSLVPGVWIARAYRVDIRKVGSGNIGSTNAYRALGFWAGAVVQVIDILKAALPTYLAMKRGLPSWSLYLIVSAAVIGHIYPIWGKFQGGKGINTLLGGMLVLQPLSALAAVGTFLLTLSLSQIVSVSSLVAVGSFLVWHAFIGEGTPVGYIMGGLWWLLVVYTHRSNLARLWAGTEPRIGSSKR